MGCAGCGRPEPEVSDAAAPFVRLDLRIPERLESSPIKSRVVEEFTVPPEVEPWVVRGSRYSAVAAAYGGHSKPVLRLIGQRAVVEIPTVFRGGDFSRIEVTLLSRGTSKIDVMLAREGFHWRSERKKVSKNAPRTINFDVPEDLEGSFSSVYLQVSPISDGVDLFGVRLLQVPQASLLPQVAEGAELVVVGGEARRALGLASERPLVAEFVVPRNGRLSFSYAAPVLGYVDPTEGLERLDGAHPESVADQSALLGPELVVNLLGAEGSVGSTVREFTVADRSRWNHVELDLSECPGQLLKLLLAVRSADGSEVACAVSEPTVWESGREVPAVLLVTSDTHRFDHLGEARRGLGIQTPELDELAARGVFFENCLTSSNVTLPSHVSLFTGRTPRDTGIFQNHVPLVDAADTLAERFAEQGYATLAVVSATHLGGPQSGLGQGFDRMSWPTSLRTAEEAVGLLEGWVNELDGQPLFAWLHLFDAHTPYRYEEGFSELYYEGDPYDASFPEPAFPVPKNYPGVRDVEFVRALYRGEVSYLDAALGRLFEHERFERGIVAVTADHGENLGEHGIWWDHAGLYTEALHVPMILAWPGGPRGARESRGVRQIDIGRTLLDLSGLAQSEFPGQSLADPEVIAVEPRFAISSGHREASITVGSMHLVLNLRRHHSRHNLGGAQLQAHSVELFDIGTDPACSNNLALTEFNTAQRMRELLIEWLLAVDDPGWAGEAHDDEESLAALAELGYVIEVEVEAEREGLRFIDPDCTCQRCQIFASSR